jgi:hypothetical protein
MRLCSQRIAEEDYRLNLPHCYTGADDQIAPIRAMRDAFHRQSQPLRQQLPSASRCHKLMPLEDIAMAEDEELLSKVVDGERQAAAVWGFTPSMN